MIMKFKFSLTVVLSGLVASALLPLPLPAAPQAGTFSWRGPFQNGTSTEKGLPDAINAKEAVWSIDFPGASTPVIANGKVYVMGYEGEGPELKEGVACFDAETGKRLWSKMYNDFLSDTIYLRYATSSPTIDPETGNVYIQCTQGIFACLSSDGKLIWEHSMMESFGRLTFPNGRTASPVVDKDLVITRGITANWGAQGPAGDRFYAFDKKTGELAWSSTPADRPKDNSYSHPILGWLDGKRVFYSATGDGSVVCVNARTGDPIWRVPLFKSGINATLLVHNNDKVIAIYGTPYEPGQMVALKISHEQPTNAAAAPLVLERSKTELWANDLRTSTSSPILVGDRIYVVSEVGDLNAIDVNTGKLLWKIKIGIEQRNSCPLYADGKIYVPMLNDSGSGEKVAADESGPGRGAFFVIKPSDTEGKVLSHTTLEGRCFGTPAAYNGKIYQQTTRKLYCFGKAGNNNAVKVEMDEKWPAPGKASQLLIIPSEVLLHPGQEASFRVRALDKNGLSVEDIKDSKAIKWASFIPPTAKVKATMKGSFTADGKLVAAPESVPSAGAFEATVGDLKGYFRGRVLPGLPIKQDFESFKLTETNEVENAMFAYPPLPWIGARFKFEVRQTNGNMSLTKTIDNKFFQRATVFMGDPNLKNYTIEADVMSEGNRRKMSDVGVINQRYMIVLKGNEQTLEINSNQELLKIMVPFKWTPNVWYHLKTKLVSNPDGSGEVQAKVWKREEKEPEEWTSKVAVKTLHPNGCPGLFGFSPQDMRVFIDNVAVTAN
ncbi:MAG: Pyrrolo-quinoline quinone repeat-containing protein [Verrucomicrobiales bacterium]|jgi:outer membrane protein assembly factor BamB|nr:Pyrrolo-quinoline quinone repeat-containing protein [Verrucomicrobiales bacterium]